MACVRVWCGDVAAAGQLQALLARLHAVQVQANVRPATHHHTPAQCTYTKGIVMDNNIYNIIQGAYIIMVICTRVVCAGEKSGGKRNIEQQRGGHVILLHVPKEMCCPR